MTYYGNRCCLNLAYAKKNNEQHVNDGCLAKVKKQLKRFLFSSSFARRQPAFILIIHPRLHSRPFHLKYMKHILKNLRENVH